MSIVPLARITFYAHVDDKETVLTDLQGFGCLHLIPLAPEEERIAKAGPSSHSREALRFLAGCRYRRRQVKDPSGFHASAIERQALDLRDRIHALGEERDFLQGRISNLRPWGDFEFPPREELAGLRLWFYVVPHHEMNGVEETGLIWEAVFHDNRFSYVAVISENEPQGMPVSRVRTGDKSIAELEARLEAVEIELEDLQAERSGLTRWCDLFAGSIHRLEDRAEVSEAFRLTLDKRPVFALQAWAPVESLPGLEQYAAEKGLGMDAVQPDPGESPPTLMRNPPALAGGQDLVSFYTTPRYWRWDPSIIVFFSFALFFAMIFADAGYSALLGVIAAALWKRMGRSDAGRRFRILMGVLVGMGVGYGVMVGSYFGISPPEGSILRQLKCLDMMNFDQMMKLSILTGVSHLVLANAVTAWHGRRSPAAVVPAAWILIFTGGVALWLGTSGGGDAVLLRNAGIAVMGAGAMGVLLFNRLEGPLWRRLLGGLLGLARLSNVFGDSLSYLRLFALGLASASLAATFNDLAGQVRTAVPGIGLLFALVILLLGHSLNFVLALASGVIHGLRLNFIEFFNWSISEEGRPFKAFARKETRSWKT
ncbi:MAG: hypothetical protein JRK53_02725 [Deltaproteobacteria bacterium]|nr:hypothetical protein [Deltaproteobacteria bacterium]MBW2283046.1 hypothetical protein [Deltaproteobacteria bacterium]